MPSKQFQAVDSIVLQVGGGGIKMSNGDTIVDSDGNIDAPVTTTNLSTTGTTTLGNSVSDDTTISGDLTVDVDTLVSGDLTVTGSVSIGGATINNNVISDTITMATDKKIQFRDTGLFIHSNADGKLTLSSDGVGTDDITVVGSVTHTGDFQQTGLLTVGVDDTGHDVKFFGATAGKSWLWDESADKMIVTGTSTLDGDVTLGTASGIVSGTANGIVPLVYNAVQNAVATSTAIGVTTYNTTIDSTSGALALTLAAGTFKGQKRRVQMIVDNGDATLTFNGASTIVFADVGDVAELVYSGSAWVPVALYNCADGATAPVYTP